MCKEPGSNPGKIQLIQLLVCEVRDSKRGVYMRVYIYAFKKIPCVEKVSNKFMYLSLNM